LTSFDPASGVKRSWLCVKKYTWPGSNRRPSACLELRRTARASHQPGRREQGVAGLLGAGQVLRTVVQSKSLAFATLGAMANAKRMGQKPQGRYAPMKSLNEKKTAVRRARAAPRRAHTAPRRAHTAPRPRPCGAAPVRRCARAASRPRDVAPAPRPHGAAPVRRRPRFLSI
jgi:hypothetical protein